jgi:hypothetical protein
MNTIIRSVLVAETCNAFTITALCLNILLTLIYTLLAHNEYTK